MNIQQRNSSEDDEKKYKENPKSMDGVPDLSMLTHLKLKNVLHNLRYRYCEMPKKHCYTSISTILVAINPYERLPIYGQDVLNEFHEAMKKGRLPQERPHPYAVSARAYMRMIQRKCNQSIVICGETGSGKTETAKLIMRYLVMTAPAVSMESGIIEQQIVAASPILEAYGNAKTVLNNNSSRFGIFLKILYDVPERAREGYILGCYLETYLLEKSRVTFQQTNERNFHIPYFLYHGISKDKHNEFGIINPNKWFYTNQGDAVEVTGIDDAERSQEVFESLRMHRIDDAIQADIWRLTTGVFNLGNIGFKRENDGFAGIDKKTQSFVDIVARLWGITSKAITDRLTSVTLKIMKKCIVKKVSYDQVTENRDYIAKGFYEKIFLYLGERINAELYQTDEDDISSVLFIGILDMFGCGNFHINSFEQFCFNFVNEKLQQFFNYHIIQSEQEEYIKESVFWIPVNDPNNLEYINMMEDKQNGFFSLLDAVCKQPQPTIEGFLQCFNQHHGKKTCVFNLGMIAPYDRQKDYIVYGFIRLFKMKKFIPSDIKLLIYKYVNLCAIFIVNHYFGKVEYDITTFVSRNMESMHSDTTKMFKKSSIILAKQIGGAGQRRKKKQSQSAIFHRGIKTLMKNLKATEPYFVRCMNPNIQQSASIWTECIVENQLKSSGLVQGLKVLKAGYPCRVPYIILYERYHRNVTNPLIKNMGPEAFSIALLIAFDVCENDYELGLTKIFFRPSKAMVLDTIMSNAGKPLSKEQNDKITVWVVEKRIKQITGLCRTFLELSKRIRLVRADQRWRYSGRVASLLSATVVKHLKMVRQAIKQRNDMSNNSTGKLYKIHKRPMDDSSDGD